MTAEEVLNKIMDMTPKIDNSTLLKQWATGVKYTIYTSKISFEELVWQICKPNKDLANEVMELADGKLKLK